MPEVPMKFISLVPQNNTEFDVADGNLVSFHLEPQLGMVKGRDSHLLLKICNVSSDNTRVMLNNVAGANGLIQRIDCYSLKTGQHIETLDEYAMFNAFEHQYFYEQKNNLQMLEGCGEKVYVNEDIGQGLDTVENSAKDVANSVLSPVSKTDGSALYNFRTYTVPIKLGCFSWYDDEKLLPLIMMGGLKIDIRLASAKTSCFVMHAQDLTGQNVEIIGSGGIACDDVAGAPSTTIVTTADYGSINDCAFAVGNLVKINNDAGADLLTSITSISIATNKITFTLADAVPVAGTIKIVMRDGSDTRALKVRPEMRLLTMAPPDNLMSASSFEYEFTSYDHYIDALPSSTRKHLVEFNSVATRALSIFTAFSDQALEQGLDTSSKYNTALPSQLNLDSVQYFIDGRLIPVRSYDPNEKKEKIIAQHELNKAFTSINRLPKDLGNTDNKSLGHYTNSFIIARQLARPPYFYKLDDAEGQIRLGFSAGRGSSNYNIHTFIFSKKILMVSQDGGVQVSL